MFSLHDIYHGAPIFLWIFYATNWALRFACYDMWIRPNSQFFGSSVSTAYLVLTVINLAAWLLPISYVFKSSFMDVQTEDAARNFMAVGVVFGFFLCDLPLWLLDWYIVTSFGWSSLVQSVTFVYCQFSFILGVFIVWFVYSTRMAIKMNDTNLFQLGSDSTSKSHGTGIFIGRPPAPPPPPPNANISGPPPLYNPYGYS